MTDKLSYMDDRFAGLSDRVASPRGAQATETASGEESPTRGPRLTGWLPISACVVPCGTRVLVWDGSMRVVTLIDDGWECDEGGYCYPTQFYPVPKP